MPRWVYGRCRLSVDRFHRSRAITRSSAAAAGLSLSDYVKQDLESAAARPTLEEIDARVSERGRSAVRARTVLSALRDVGPGS